MNLLLWRVLNIYDNRKDNINIIYPSIYPSPNSNNYLVMASLFFAIPCNMWDLSSQPGIKPMPPTLGVQILNYWTTKEAPITSLVSSMSLSISPHP